MKVTIKQEGDINHLDIQVEVYPNEFASIKDLIECWRSVNEHGYDEEASEQYDVEVMA